MEQVPMGDHEILLMIEEEKRLCEKNVEFIKGILQKGISEKDGEIVDKDRSSPSIKLNRRLEHKELYKSTDALSLWKLIKDDNKLILILEIKFPKTNAPELHFCFEMIIDLFKANKERIVKIMDKEYKATLYQLEKNTDTILQWMELLVETEEINITDGEDPSIGIEQIPIDIPITILEFFNEFINRGGRLGKKEEIIVLRGEELKKYFI